jgi:hypothetical protein
MGAPWLQPLAISDKSTGPRNRKMVKVDHLLVREGVDFLASQRRRVTRIRRPARFDWKLSTRFHERALWRVTSWEEFLVG